MARCSTFTFVIPAKAGIQVQTPCCIAWVPAFAEMTKESIAP
jgi:hypothetical protein